MTSYGIVIFLIILMGVTGIFGGHFGYTVDGVPKGGETGTGGLPPGEYKIGDIPFFDTEPVYVVEPGDKSIVGDMLDFFFNLMTFQIDGLLPIFGILFIAIPFICGWIIYRQLRGQD